MISVRQCEALWQTLDTMIDSAMDCQQLLLKLTKCRTMGETTVNLQSETPFVCLKSSIWSWSSQVDGVKSNVAFTVDDKSTEAVEEVDAVPSETPQAISLPAMKSIVDKIVQEATKSNAVEVKPLSPTEPDGGGPLPTIQTSSYSDVLDFFNERVAI